MQVTADEQKHVVGKVAKPKRAHSVWPTFVLDDERGLAEKKTEKRCCDLYANEQTSATRRADCDLCLPLLCEVFRFGGG